LGGKYQNSLYISQCLTVLNSAGLKHIYHKMFDYRKIERNLQNPEVLEARKVHFSNSGDVVSVQIPTEKNTDVTDQT